jgi:CubicO group peptidase (beta-lactamase class C family)
MLKKKTSRDISSIILAILLSASFSAPSWAQSAAPAKAPAQTGDAEIAAAVGALLEKTYKPDQPGAAVIVVKDGRVVFRKGYGKANLELGVPIEPDMIFRIGSITKQFTAVSILKLAEEGKLSLSDEVTRFLPDYPTNGKKITVEHLLTHTSGIKSYTSLPEWLGMWRKDISLTELIALFKDKPMDFEPGEGWLYNNSAYVLLGAIIEKVSGQPYQDYVEKQIFAPLGMTHSFYDRTDRVIPRRVAGYSKGRDGWVNCAYLSMTQPHAAGSLISSVDDLALWDAALYTDKALKQESLRRAWTSYKLNNGKATHYGYGWSIQSYEGHKIVTHDGGINGFITSGYRLPDDKVYVSVLTNSDSPDVNPSEVAFKIAAIAIGKPFQTPVAMKLSAEKLDAYTGVYQADEKTQVIVRRDGEKLFLHRGIRKTEIAPMSETEFFIPSQLRGRLTFIKSAAGISGYIQYDSYGTDQEFRKTDKPDPAAAARP